MRKSVPRTPKQTLFDRMRTTVRGYVLRGLLVLVPLGITAYALDLCYRLTAANLAPLVRRLNIPIPEYAVPYAVVAISVLLFFALLYTFGVLAAIVIGRRLLGVGEAILRRIPLVKTVYAASKQVMEVLQPKDETAPSYQEAVFIDFPGPGIKALGFVVGRSQIQGLGEYCRIFVPTTPNPTSGYFEMYPADQVQHTDMTVEDAVKGALSAGILIPDTVDLSMEAGAARGSSPAADYPVSVEAPTKHTSLWQFTKSIFRRRIVSGFFVLVPIAITVFVVKFVYDFTAGRIEFLTYELLRPIATYLPVRAAPAVAAIASILLLLVGLYVTGYIATWVVGDRIIRLGEAVLRRIPLIATIYGGSKQLMETLVVQKGGGGFKEAVFVEFPYPGVLAAGFLVGQTRTTAGQLLYRVFVPTAPNISVGLLQFYAPDQVYSSAMGVEETIKMVVSCGILAPDTLRLVSFAESTGAVGVEVADD